MGTGSVVNLDAAGFYRAAGPRFFITRTGTGESWITLVATDPITTPASDPIPFVPMRIWSQRSRWFECCRPVLLLVTGDAVAPDDGAHTLAVGYALLDIEQVDLDLGPDPAEVVSELLYRFSGRFGPVHRDEELQHSPLSCSFVIA